MSDIKVRVNTSNLTAVRVGQQNAIGVIASTSGAQGLQGVSGPVAGSANQIVYKDGSNNPTGSGNLTFGGTNLYVGGTTLITGITTIGLGSTSTPPNNSQLSFELITDTNLRIKVRGSDGVLRSANITLS